jgi:hypothetical protein
VTKTFSVPILALAIQKKPYRKSTANTLVRETLEETPTELSGIPHSSRTPWDVLQRDRRYHRHARRHRNVELIAYAEPASSDSDRPK